MSVEMEGLQQKEKLFRDVIQHLKQRIRALDADEEVDDIDLVEEERTPADQSTRTALRLEICLYSLCLDWFRQQQEELAGFSDGARQHARQNFFRLMTTVAQSELSRDTHALSFGFSGNLVRERPPSAAQLFTALEGTAERQLAALIAL